MTSTLSLEASAAEEWPLLPDYQPPPTSRLEHLIATTPTIDITAAQPRRTSTPDPDDDDDPLPPFRPSHKRKGGDASPATAPAGPPVVPTFRGGGEEAEDDGDEGEEERLSRVQPDELYDPTSDDRDQRLLEAEHRQPTPAPLPLLIPSIIYVQGIAHAALLLCALCCVGLPRSGRVSDAVLSCPCCFTQLCLDCQRHTRFPHQYRAMFVQHCTTQPHKRVLPLQPPPSRAEGKRRKQRKSRGGAEEDEEEDEDEDRVQRGYLSVCCEVCGTEVGAVEADGPHPLYHFFHVIDSSGG